MLTNNHVDAIVIKNHERGIKMTKTNLLKAKIVENGFSVTDLSAIVGISRAQFAKKVNGQVAFNQREIAILQEQLHLNSGEVVELFLMD